MEVRVGVGGCQEFGPEIGVMIVVVVVVVVVVIMTIPSVRRRDRCLLHYAVDDDHGMTSLPSPSMPLPSRDRPGLRPAGAPSE